VSTAGGHVVVVGGGLAGLAAALTCADGGARVTLLERRPRLGGATWSFEHHGLHFDNGQHVFLRCCTSYRRFLDRIGAADRVTLQPRLDVPVIAPGGRVAHLRRDPLPAPLHLGRALARYSHLSLRDRVRLGRAALALERLEPSDPALDTTTFGAWLAAHGQSRAAIDRVWNLIALPTINVDSAEASLAPAAMVFRTGLLADATAADIGWSRVPLSELHAEPAARALTARGARVRTGARVETVTAADGAHTVVVDGEALDADAVIVAVPPDAAGSLLPESALAAGASADFAALGKSPIVNVHLVYDRRVLDFPFVAGVGSPVQYVFDRTGSSGMDPAEGQCVAISLSGADQFVGRPARDLVADLSAAMVELFPGAADARVVDSIVTREQDATFRAIPGTAALRPATHTRVDGLFLAGAWTATGWPATMEGAVRSGEDAARAALSTLARRGAPRSAPFDTRQEVVA
jgi:squalene-associated FAD-dependent desaturase